jgi:hypothetical protein
LAARSIEPQTGAYARSDPCRSPLSPAFEEPGMTFRGRKLQKLLGSKACNRHRRRSRPATLGQSRSLVKPSQALCLLPTVQRPVILVRLCAFSVGGLCLIGQSGKRSRQTEQLSLQARRCFSYAWRVANTFQNVRSGYCTRPHPPLISCVISAIAIQRHLIRSSAM